MEDKKILTNMVGSKTRKYQNRTDKIVEVANSIYDDFNDPNAATNMFYIKWINLVHMHKDGRLILTGRFKTANGFISVASQFGERFIPTSELLGDGVTMDENVTSFLDPMLFRALSRKDKVGIISYIQDRGDWVLSRAEKDSLLCIVDRINYETA